MSLVYITYRTKALSLRFLSGRIGLLNLLRPMEVVQMVKICRIRKTAVHRNWFVGCALKL